MKISKEQIVVDLKNVYKKLGVVPTASLYEKHGTYGKNTIKRKFGTWNKALLDSIGLINVNRSNLIELTERICKHCLNKFIPKHNTQQFCSRTCSATFNNKQYPKKRIKNPKKCASCDNLISERKRFCVTCNEKNLEKLSNTPISEFTRKSNDANRYSKIRMQSRLIMKNEKQICTWCDYIKHVEVCHKRAIKSFPPETLVKEIKEKTNLIILCRNCHWELDHPDANGTG